MERIVLNQSNSTEAASRAAATLRAGGVILYPTDTLYGLGADAFSDEAVAKIYAIKGREERKPMHATFADLAQAREYAEVTPLAESLAERFLPGALTLILKKKGGLDAGVVRGLETIGIRIPDNAFCLEVAKQFGPYTATSANKSGLAPLRRVADIEKQLGPAWNGIDFVVDGGELSPRAATTVVDLSGAQPALLREGAIPAAQILSFLGH